MAKSIHTDIAYHAQLILTTLTVLDWIEVSVCLCNGFWQNVNFILLPPHLSQQIFSNDCLYSHDPGLWIMHRSCLHGHLPMLSYRLRMGQIN